MNYTTNYQLNQWDAEDRVTREDFNADNLAIDAALAALAGGGVKIAYGTYTGDGVYDSTHWSSLTFDFEPKVLILQRRESAGFNVTSTGDDQLTVMALRGVEQFSFLTRGDTYDTHFIWDGNTVSWWNNMDARHQMNEEGKPHAYLALG